MPIFTQQFFLNCKLMYIVNELNKSFVNLAAFSKLKQSTYTNNVAQVFSIHYFQYGRPKFQTQVKQKWRNMTYLIRDSKILHNLHNSRNHILYVNLDIYKNVHYEIQTLAASFI